MKNINFEEEINELENINITENFVVRTGNIPILFTAVHTMNQKKDDGSIKYMESYTKAIALYLNKHANVNCMVKINDT